MFRDEEGDGVDELHVSVQGERSWDWVRYLVVRGGIPARELGGVGDAAFEAVGAEGAEGDGCCA